ncbi:MULTISPECIES: hypothetical protein [Mycobacteriaceae]|jgi:hypothetical protein|uniref:hypothetical protein n=1 Tax=Mycobacteriaceae TaxID=1762 RepID=UPI000A0382A9|nr:MULTISPECIES: hypothetical protein [Mycobacteriaceae]MBU8840241.1 hypothetical protein [Mycolicibacterium goodii]UCN12636.1 hypothetical protein LFT50_29540 [Mycobacterium intracellulare subsp. chimaera]
MEQACCDNCGHTCDAAELDPIRDLFERIEPGGTVPSGECPQCGALAYPPTVRGGKSITGELR